MGFVCRDFKLFYLGFKLAIYGKKNYKKCAKGEIKA